MRDLIDEETAMSHKFQADRIAIFQDRQRVMDLIMELDNAGKFPKSSKKALIYFLVDLISE